MEGKLIIKSFFAIKSSELTHYEAMNFTSSDYLIKQSHNIYWCPPFCHMIFIISSESDAHEEHKMVFEAT